MALLQIAEPGQSTKPHEHRLAVGIDLGTTNSLVATVRSGISETLPDEQGRHLLPSIVRFLKDQTIVGYDAQASAVEDPLNTIASVKRLMGRGVSDLAYLGRQLPYEFVDHDASVPRIKTPAGDKSAIEVSSEILKSLKQRSEQALGGDIVGAVITVPAYFDDAQRQATKDAARLANIEVLRLLNEPTAAAVAYGLDSGQEGVIAVYDLGGGTFDISILRLNKGVFEVLATGGDSALGGDDFDRSIAEWIIAQAGKDASNLSLSVLRQIQNKACDAKVALSQQHTIDIELAELDWSGSLDRDQFNQLVDPLIKKTLMACRRALRDADVDRDGIHDVVMVGGSTRSYRVREQVGDFFARPPLVDIDPDKVVAIGAAVQANALAGNDPDGDMLLMDVIPLSLGLETMGGLSEKIISRNTPIPVSRAQEFTTYKDGQTAMAIHVVQGEREMIEDCRSLARFELRDIPPHVAGAARIRVTFQVDADGLLSVSAREETANIEAHVQVKPSYGLNDQEIESMLRASIDHAQDDKSARSLREQQVEADRVIEALDAAMSEDADSMMDEQEKSRISKARSALIDARNQASKPDLIKQAMDDLEKASASYVARRMNSSVQSSMAGHKVEEFTSDDRTE